MHRWKTGFAVLLAVFYPLAAGYCLLEKVDLVPKIDCCETASQHQEEKACGYGCCPIEYAVYSSLDAGIIDLSAPPADFVLFKVVLVMEFPAEAASFLLDRSPTNIPKSWQFSFRAALPPRAPSLAS